MCQLNRLFSAPIYQEDALLIAHNGSTDPGVFADNMMRSPKSWVCKVGVSKLALYGTCNGRKFLSLMSYIR